MIEVHDLVKWYGPTLAVDHLNFTIPEGQVVGFLGPNGAGKSTTLRMLTGYLPPSSGSVRVAGIDVSTASEEARAKLGYLPESTPLYPEMRVEEYLDFRGRLMSMDRPTRRSRIDVVCERCGLQLVRRRVIGHLSKGNRQRVGLAQALLHDPPVLILDEPTAGLDPNQIGEVRKLISELRGRHTVIVSTHILPEVEKSADRVMIIARGKVVAEGSPDELRQRVTEGARVLVEVKASSQSVAKALEGLPVVASVETTTHNGWCIAAVTPRNSQDVREAIGQALLTNQWAIREMRYETASLEQFFVQITAAQDQSRSAEVSAA